MFIEVVEKVRAVLIKEKHTGALGSVEVLGSAILDRSKMTRLQAALENRKQDLNEEGLFRGVVDGAMENLCSFFTLPGKRVRNSPQKWACVNLHGPPRHSCADFKTVFVLVSY